MPVGMIGGLRLVASGGPTALAALSITDIVTFSIVAGEVVCAYIWVTDNTAGAAFSQGAPPAAVANRVTIFFQRTANALEAILRADNANVATVRNINWAVVAFRRPV